MQRELFDSIDEMVDPRTLRELTGQPITDVRLRPFETCGVSGSGEQFLVIETNGGSGQRYILKRISLEWDWIMRATDDRRGREAALWQAGFMDRLPAEVTHAIIACARNEEGWAILMRDVTDALLPWKWEPGQPLNLAQTECCLEGLAALHATFLQDPALASPAVGLCSIPDFYRVVFPETGHREVNSSSVIPGAIVRGWNMLKRVVEPDIVVMLYELFEEPEPLFKCIRQYPFTLVHGDPRPVNLGWLRKPQPQLLMLDWAFACAAPPAVDLAWYIGDAFLPISKDEAISHYREALATRLGSRFDEQWWQPQLEISLLANFLRHGWRFTLRLVDSQDEAMRDRCQKALTWWSERARKGAKWL